ncbi:MAG TPA: hypothetical protein PLI45_00830 [Candidatus Woesebacteria bacterium]|nr:hypothetical protein [Candidatus Woesebacteria bacterium]
MKRLLVFTYAPAGLGHLRVTDALVDSRPKDLSYLMLGSYDRFITSFHRFFSVNPIGKFIFTLNQYGFLEDIVTAIYRRILIMTSGQMYRQMKSIVQSKQDIDEIWVIATHFGMAHQLGAVKDRLAKDTGKKIKLIVQVTDDTTQHIWCIRGADLTFVPSLLTKEKLLKYASRHKIDSKYEVIPYPLCPILTAKLDVSKGRDQALGKSKQKINVAVPISGASVGLNYATKLITELCKKSDRFKFWVLVKKSVYTDHFINELSKLTGVSLITGRNDNEMISLYELLYQENLIHLEITKPSEQSFKAILPPACVGGSILLFTAPVGRQEYENMEFLKRHGLMPGYLDTTPRAISLPENPLKAADFVIQSLETGLFLRMSLPSFQFSEASMKSGEVGSSGSEDFWKKVESLLG